MTTRSHEVLRPSLHDTPVYRTNYMAERVGLHKLNHNEAPADLPDEVKDEVLRRLRRVPWHRYPDPFHAEIKARLSAYTGHPADGILLTNGGNDAIFRLLLALDPARPVVTCPPSYYLYERVTRMLGLARREVLLRTPGFAVDWEGVRQAASPPGVVLLTSPNNPTGNLVDRAGLAAFLADCEGLVLLDEAYFELAGETLLDLQAAHPGLLVLRTMSKAFGVAGLRLGFLLGEPGIIGEIDKVTVPYSVDALTQAAGAALLDRPDLMEARVAALRAERARLMALIAQIDGLAPLPSAANFFLVRVAPERGTPAALVEALKARDIILRDVSALPLLSDCFRVTVGTPADGDAIVEALRSL